VGLIALAGIDAETGVVMLLYLTISHRQWREEGRLRNFGDLKEAIVVGAAQRIRPKLMTVLTDMVGLLPVLLSTGTGADLMKRIAAPLVGGLAMSFLLELTVYPAIFAIWKAAGFTGLKPVLYSMSRPAVRGRSTSEMRNHLIALLLLLVFGGGLLAGPHPCQAREAAPDSGKSKSGCHGSHSEASSTPEQSAPASDGEDNDCCAGEHGTGCEHACHMVAVVQIQAVIFAVAPQKQLASPAIGRSLPLFTHPIDHIPLV
jgi:hypothetical protein